MRKNEEFLRKLFVVFCAILERIELESWDWSQIEAKCVWKTEMSLEFILAQFVWKWHQKTGLWINQLVKKIWIFQEQDLINLACFEGYTLV